MPCFCGNCVYRWRVRQVAVEDCWFGKTLSSNSRVSTTGTSPVTRVWMMLFHPQNVPPHGGVISKSSETLAVRVAVLNTYDWSSTLPAAFFKHLQPYVLCSCASRHQRRFTEECKHQMDRQCHLWVKTAVTFYYICIIIYLTSHSEWKKQKTSNWGNLSSSLKSSWDETFQVLSVETLLLM